MECKERIKRTYIQRVYNMYGYMRVESAKTIIDVERIVCLCNNVTLTESLNYHCSRRNESAAFSLKPIFYLVIHVIRCVFLKLFGSQGFNYWVNWNEFQKPKSQL